MNRNKNYHLDAMPMNGQRTILKMDEGKLTKLQCYLWQWYEVILRYQRFVDGFGIKKRYVLNTYQLNDITEVEKLFDYFEIPHNPISHIKPQHTNLSEGKQGTHIHRSHVRQYHHFLKMIPGEIRNAIRDTLDR